MPAPKTRVRIAFGRVCSSAGNRMGKAAKTNSLHLVAPPEGVALLEFISRSANPSAPFQISTSGSRRAPR